MMVVMVTAEAWFDVALTTEVMRKVLDWTTLAFRKTIHHLREWPWVPHSFVITGCNFGGIKI